jgi:heme-degrading monooxygenase HmoA
MHARVSFYEQAGDVDAALQTFQTAVGAVQDLEGNQGATLLVDRNSAKAITITYWDTEEHLQASVEAANRLRQQAADASGLSIRSVEHYEVALEVGR